MLETDNYIHQPPITPQKTMSHPYLKLSPFKIGLLVVLASVCLFYSFGNSKPQLLTSFDNRLVDALFNLRGKTSTSNSVVIVDLDDESMAKIGQWPWPRNIVAELSAAIHRSGAKSVGFDIVFAEQDRTSPKHHLDNFIDLLGMDITPEQLKGLQEDPNLDYDLIFGDTLAEIPSVLGYVFETRRHAKADGDVPFPSANIRLDPPATPLTSIDFIKASNAIINNPDVSQAESEGFFNVFPDPSGTIRKVPLLMSYNDVPYPSLALEVLRVGAGEQNITIHLSRQIKSGQNGILGITIANTFIPTDNQGQLTVNYRGGVQTFPYISAVDILQGKRLDTLRDKYVLIGTSAAGLLDLRATPFANIFPGVEIQANVIDNILGGNPLTYDLYTEIGLTYFMVITSGIFLTALLSYATPLAGGLGGILCILATLCSSYLFFMQNQIVGITYPLITIIIVFLLVTLANYFYAGREKIFLRNAFGHYVSPDVVTEIIKDPASLSLSGQVQNLTIFFSDIRDFTTISEKMTPDQLGRFMNRYLTVMSDILLENDGTVDKYIGDAIMAIWGAPLRDTDHAAKAVRASLVSMEILKSLQNDFKADGLPRVAIGIGLNTGEVNVGNFGSNQRFDYTVLGDNVNLASRLEGLTKVYGCDILITQSTKDALGEDFLCCFVDRVQVKGKKLPVNIYEPLCEGIPHPDLLQKMTDFEKGIAAYQQQDFENAGKIFKSLNDDQPRKLFSLYLERVEAYKVSPPPADWDGVFIFTTK